MLTADTLATRPNSSRLQQPGDVVRVRAQRHLVQEVVAPGGGEQQTLVPLCCIDDDSQGTNRTTNPLARREASTFICRAAVLASEWKSPFAI